MKNIAITGMGVLTAAGIGKANFWRNIRHGKSFITPITRFDSSRYPSRIAGQIKDLDAYSNISPRLLKKIDAFSHMSLVACELALKDAHIDLSKENLDRVGMKRRSESFYGFSMVSCSTTGADVYLLWNKRIF